MSTTEKGDAFEERVYKILAEELRMERLIASPKSAQLFRKKAYHSKDRDANIVVDLSMEMFLPGRPHPSFIWIFECKDYSGSVPVDDIEEFHAKLQQIGEDNTKGTFVTSGALQRSALNYADSKRIGVVRLLPSDQLDIVLELVRKQHGAAAVDWSEFATALLYPNHRSRRSFFAFQDGHWFATWHSMLSHRLELDAMPKGDSLPSG